MKILTYKILGFVAEYNAATKQTEQKECLSVVTKLYSKENEEIARQEAYNGEYTIEEDDTAETIGLSQEARITELKEALELLLSGGTE